MFISKVKCIECQREFSIPIQEDEVEAWRNGKAIQLAMPSLTPGQRELLISETCEECFEELFKEE